MRLSVAAGKRQAEATLFFPIFPVESCLLHIDVYCLPQVRFRGMKGVLCLNPGLPGRMLRYRKSMSKFGSAHSTLEVVTIATNIPYFLNR